MAEILRVIKGEYALLKFIALEHHPNDSRILIKEDGVCQSLTTRMGTGGGGNVPLILAIHETEEQTDDSLRSSIEG